MISVFVYLISLLLCSTYAADTYVLRGQVVPADVANMKNPLNNKILTVKIEDIALQDAPSVVISSQTIRLGDNQKFPVPFEILCPANLINSDAPKHFYSISARITDAETNDLVYITDQVTFLPTIEEIENDIFLRVVSVEIDIPNKDVCSLSPETGNCLAYFVRYYYDPASKTCKEFVWGGCGGNLNKFNTKEECESKCKPNNLGADVVQFDDICKLEPVVGPCKALIERYFYNSTSQRCETFYYGGCFGNPNNFEDEKICSIICHK